MVVIGQVGDRRMSSGRRRPCCHRKTWRKGKVRGENCCYRRSDLVVHFGDEISVETREYFLVLKERKSLAGERFKCDRLMGKHLQGTRLLILRGSLALVTGAW